MLVPAVVPGVNTPPVEIAAPVEPLILQVPAGELDNVLCCPKQTLAFPEIAEGEVFVVTDTVDVVGQPSAL